MLRMARTRNTKADTGKTDESELPPAERGQQTAEQMHAARREAEVTERETRNMDRHGARIDEDA